MHNLLFTWGKKYVARVCSVKTVKISCFEVIFSIDFHSHVYRSITANVHACTTCAFGRIFEVNVHSKNKKDVEISETNLLPHRIVIV